MLLELCSPLFQPHIMHVWDVCSDLICLPVVVDMLLHQFQCTETEFSKYGKILHF